MTKIYVSVKGVSSSQKSLHKLSNRAKKKLYKINAETAYNIDADAKLILTQASAVDTGRLRSSIHVESTDIKAQPYTDDKGNSFESKLELSAKENELIVGTNVEYAAFIHDGFRKQKTNFSFSNAPSTSLQFAPLKFKSYNGTFFLSKAFNKNLNAHRRKVKKILK